MILEDLYSRNREKNELPPAYWDLRKRMTPYDMQIQQTLGLSFLDEYTNLYAQSSDLMEQHYFRAGVQFTLRFLLEGLLQNPHL